MTELRGHVEPRGHLTATVMDASTGAVLRVIEQSNLVVTAGRNQIRDAINGAAITAPNRFAIGTGSTTASAADTALVTEVWRDAFTSKTTSTASISIKYFLTSTTANGNTIREAGLFNASTGGEMYARVVLTDAIAKTASIAVLFSWTLTWSAS